jgi:solute carrier family 25 carnitine/acylcarnitine transporter 20/29
LHFIKVYNQVRLECMSHFAPGMASPLIGIAGVNSLLFASYAISKRIVSPFPELSLPETAAAGAMAGATNSILASPGM